MTTISGKIFIIIFFLFLPYPITAVYFCFLSLLFLFFVSILFSFSPFFRSYYFFLSSFYAFPPRYSVFQSVSRTFLIYLYIFLFDFHHFPINLFFLMDFIYISVYDYIYNKIPNIIYK